MDEEAAPAPVPADGKVTIAREIYAKFRNTHCNHMPVELFNFLEAKSEHLIAEIAARL